jgi:multiple sugar transport system permease protein
MFIILIFPVLLAGGISFTNYNLGNPSFDWIGLENYEKMFSRKTYIKMIWATATYVLIVVPFSVVIGLCAAMLLNSLRFGGDIYKTIFFLPVMATLLAMAIAWEFTLHPTMGIVNSFLANGCGGIREFVFGFHWLPWVNSNESWYHIACENNNDFPFWLKDRGYAIWTVCFIGVWQAFGFNMVLYLAGLTSIPRELYHAAEMDGAKSTWEQFKLVTWPMLGPTTLFVITITTIRSFQVFDTIEVLTKGGPSKSTYVMMYAIFEKGIQQNLTAIAAAITVIFIAFVILLTFFQRYVIEKRVHY